MSYPDHFNQTFTLKASTLKSGNNYRLRWYSAGQALLPYPHVTVERIRPNWGPFDHYEVLHTIPVLDLNPLELGG